MDALYCVEECHEGSFAVDGSSCHEDRFKGRIVAYLVVGYEFGFERRNDPSGFVSGHTVVHHIDEEGLGCLGVDLTVNDGVTGCFPYLGYLASKFLVDASQVFCAFLHSFAGVADGGLPDEFLDVLDVVFEVVVDVVVDTLQVLMLHD